VARAPRNNVPETRFKNSISSPIMTASSPPANGASTGEAEIQTIPRSAAAENGLEQPGPRPKSAHNDLRESRQWAKDNAEWIGDDNRDNQRTLNRRRASENMLRSQPPLAAPVASNTEANPSDSRISSNAESLVRDHKISWLSRSINTGNRHSSRGSNPHRKLQVHQQLGRFVRKITDASNWASKEPTPSLNEPEEQSESDNFAQVAPNPKPGKVLTRRVSKLSKKPGMENIRAQRGDVERTPEKPSELNPDAIINLNTAENSPNRSRKIPALRKQDIEDVKKSSADLRDALSEYQSDRDGNLLPPINTDSLGDLNTGAQQKHQQHATSASATEPRHTPERLRGIDPSENTVGKTSNPGSNKSLRNPSLAPQPGPRVSSRSGAATSSTAPRSDKTALVGHSPVPVSVQNPRSDLPDSNAMAVAPPRTAAPIDRMLAFNLQRQSPLDSLSIFGPAPTKSTDTLTAITFEALGNIQPLTTYKLPEIESVALKPSTSAKLHSGFVSSGKAPGDAPNRPLPDLPKIPSSKSSERLRRGAGSSASSRSKRSVPRISTEPGRSGRTSSIASLNEILQGKDSLHGSPQRRSRSAKESGSVRSSSQKRSDGVSNLADVTGAGLALGELSTELRSPTLNQSPDFLALLSTYYATDSATRDQRIHNKRLQDVASARARRNKMVIRGEHQSIQEGLVAEDFPRPPSSRPSSHATVARQKSGSKGRAPTANFGSVYLGNNAALQTFRHGHRSPTLASPSLTSNVQVQQISRATTSSPGASPIPSPALTSASVPILNVVEPTKKHLARKSKRSHVSLQSKATLTDSQNIHGTQTPPLSESSTPSSEECGASVVGATSAESIKVRNRPRLSTGDLAAMVEDMQVMKGQLDAQMRQIHEQSNQIRAIETQKARMVHALNALIAVATETATAVPINAQWGERAAIMGSRNENLLSDVRLNRDSLASTNNTLNSLLSTSRSSGYSEFTFITEPERFSNGLTSQQGHNALEFSMDFDRMQDLVRLDRSRTSLGYDREEKASRTMKANAFGHLRIEA
jgi:hypothetical protein